MQYIKGSALSLLYKQKRIISLLRDFPYLCAFSLKAYYETTPDVKTEVLAIFEEADEDGTQAFIKKLDVSRLRPEIDVQMMYQDSRLACEGYLYRMYRTSNIDTYQIEKDFNVLIAHWKKMYERVD